VSRTVAFATLGCRLNQVDTEEMRAALERRGFRTVAFESPADVVVVNTCTVTARAEVSDRQAIARAARRHPGARVVVTGCWAQADPGAVARLPGVDLVVGNADKPRLPELVERLVDGPDRSPAGGAGGPVPHADLVRTALGSAGPARVEVSAVAALGPLAPPARPAHALRARAFVKVQDGCQHRCAFCIVPLVRGVSRSRAPAVVLDHVRALVDSGHREVTLTGVDLGHWGADLTPRSTLAALLRDLEGLPGLRWIRLSSILPAYFTPELIEVVTGSPVIAPHLHVPLQSGSDRTLRRMRRPYTTAMYGRLVERLAAARPGLGLGTDLIAGFPGESEGDFEATLALVQALPFTYLHVFGYSDRPGTEAAGLSGHLPPHAIAERSRRLRTVGEAKNLAFRRSLVGTVQEVLVLDTRERAGGRLVGLTGHYVEVLFDGPDALMRTITRVRVESVAADRTLGTLA
jgi:threonylcarbamoyladenosine tRNA methylthiotransferase MtaB